MMKQRWIVGVLAVTSLAACGSGGSDDGPYTLMFEAPDGSGFVGGEVRGIGGGSLTVYNFELDDGEAVTGTVTDGGGAPMAGVEVSFFEPSGIMPIDHATTDVNGNYSVTLSSREWRVELDTQVQALGMVEVTNVNVPNGGGVQNFGLPPTFTTTGSVTEAFGPGIASATVEFKGLNTGAEVMVTADPTGAYSAVLIPDDYEIVVTPAGASALTHLKECFPSNPLSAPGTLDFALSQGATVSGTVLDALGLPLLETTDVTVVLDAASDYFPPALVQTNPADGTYTIGPVPPGLVDFEMVAPGSLGFPLQQIPQNIAGPGPVAGVDQLLQAGLVISGTIFQDDGVTPEANALLDILPLGAGLAPESVTTDGAGNYAVSVFPGDYDVTVLPEITNLQLPQQLAGVTVSANTVQDLTLVLGSLIQGNVFQPDGITPEPDVLVGIDGLLGASDTTDPTGFFEFVAPEGSHELLLLAEEGQYEDIALDPWSAANVLAGATTNELVTMAIATVGPEVISGIVFEPDGFTPASNVEIIARNGSGDVVGRTTTSGAGSYALVVTRVPLP